jgi:hypothetical protein
MGQNPNIEMQQMAAETVPGQGSPARPRFGSILSTGLKQSIMGDIVARGIAEANREIDALRCINGLMAPRIQQQQQVYQVGTWAQETKIMNTVINDTPVQDDPQVAPATTLELRLYVGGRVVDIERQGDELTLTPQEGTPALDSNMWRLSQLQAIYTARDLAGEGKHDAAVAGLVPLGFTVWTLEGGWEGPQKDRVAEMYPDTGKAPAAPSSTEITMMQGEQALRISTLDGLANRAASLPKVAGIPLPLNVNHIYAANSLENLERASAQVREEAAKAAAAVGISAESMYDTLRKAMFNGENPVPMHIRATYSDAPYGREIADPQIPDLRAEVLRHASERRYLTIQARNRKLGEVLVERVACLLSDYGYEEGELSDDGRVVTEGWEITPVRPEMYKTLALTTDSVAVQVRFMHRPETNGEELPYAAAYKEVLEQAGLRTDKRHGFGSRSFIGYFRADKEGEAVCDAFAHMAERNLLARGGF